jgi:hypothetical protein
MAKKMRWRVCPRFNSYEISDCGDLRRRMDLPGLNQSGRRLNGFVDTDGYIRYAIRNNAGEKVPAIAAHVLVAEAFIGKKPGNNYEVAHGNGSRLLNVPGNLRWAKSIDNHADRKSHDTDAAGMRNGRAKLTDDEIRYIRRRYFEIKAERGDVGELDDSFGIHRSQVIRIAKRKAWKHIK